MKYKQPCSGFKHRLQYQFPTILSFNATSLSMHYLPIRYFLFSYIFCIYLTNELCPSSHYLQDKPLPYEYIFGEKWCVSFLYLKFDCDHFVLRRVNGLRKDKLILETFPVNRLIFLNISLSINQRWNLLHYQDKKKVKWQKNTSIKFW